MHVQINSNSSVEVTAELQAEVDAIVTNAIERFESQITRIDAHLSDQNGPRGGSTDIRCVLDARLEGLPAIAVTEDAATVEQSVRGAAGKLRRAIETAVGKRGRT